MKQLQNKSFLKAKHIDTAISSAKKLLVNFAKKHGVYENFGQHQVKELSDKFIDISDYSTKMNNYRKDIQNFSNWCMNYNHFEYHLSIL